MVRGAEEKNRLTVVGRKGSLRGIPRKEGGPAGMVGRVRKEVQPLKERLRQVLTEDSSGREKR